MKARYLEDTRVDERRMKIGCAIGCVIGCMRVDSCCARTGLKKCSPTNLSGRPLAFAMLVMGCDVLKRCMCSK